MFPRRFFALGAVAVGSIGMAHALVLFDQGPDTGPYGGAYVNQTAGQNFADQFRLSENAIVTDYDYFTIYNPDTFGATMHVKLLADGGSGAPGAYIAQEDDVTTNYFTYGTYGGQTIYEVDLKLATPWAITAGTLYWAGASGNGFEAAQTTEAPSMNPLGDGHMAQFSGPTYSFSTAAGDQSFILEGRANPAPEPASMAALGIGICGLAARRRRK